MRKPHLMTMLVMMLMIWMMIVCGFTIVYAKYVSVLLCVHIWHAYIDKDAFILYRIERSDGKPVWKVNK